MMSTVLALVYGSTGFQVMLPPYQANCSVRTITFSVLYLVMSGLNLANDDEKLK